MSLESLPELAVIRITRYLTFKDLANLSQVIPSMLYALPEIQELRGIDFNVYGHGTSMGNPETYFDVKILTRGLKSVKMQFKWKDQGFGNCKGQVWLRLLRNGRVVADSRESHYCIAPHRVEWRNVKVKGHPVVQNALRGDVLRIMRIAGGGGGHRLIVENFNMKIRHKKYPENDDVFSEDDD